MILDNRIGDDAITSILEMIFYQEKMNEINVRQGLRLLLLEVKDQ